MAKVYKLWVTLEEYDEETESGEDIGPLEIGCSGTFTDEEDAMEYALRMHQAVKDAPGWTE